MTVQTINLGKSYGKVRAVDNLSFSLDPGVVTGFLGPNGSGKSTTMRLMLELDNGEGQTLFDGAQIKDVPRAAQVVGAHLDAKSFHPTRTARNHLRMLAAASGSTNARVDEVIELMGLESVAKKKPKSFSLGMSQRLGLAGAILAEPKVLLLDEPANGLDPQSIQWLRDFLRFYASQGNVVFVSSHLLNEMQVMAEHVVVIAKGRLVADESMAQFVARSMRNDVFVRTPEAAQLVAALTARGVQAKLEGDQALSATGIDTVQVGEVAFTEGLRVWELAARTASLEQAFLEMTNDAQEYAVGGSAQNAPANAASLNVAAAPAVAASTYPTDTPAIAATNAAPAAGSIVPGMAPQRPDAAQPAPGAEPPTTAPPPPPGAVPFDAPAPPPVQPDTVALGELAAAAAAAAAEPTTPVSDRAASPETAPMASTPPPGTQPTAPQRPLASLDSDATAVHPPVSPAFAPPPTPPAATDPFRPPLPPPTMPPPSGPAVTGPLPPAAPQGHPAPLPPPPPLPPKAAPDDSAEQGGASTSEEEKG